jgi:RNA polymerase sigma factor (sigma-70 family)
VSLDDEEIADNVPLPEDALAEEERRNALKRAIMTLPPKCRNVFIMARLQGKPHSEIARECGITVSAVEKHLSRALLTCGALVGNKDL